MTPMQQMFLGLGAADKTYLDNVFSTYLYRGTGSNQSINNGIDFASDGGLCWIKMRTQANKNHQLFDTARGAGKYIASNDASAAEATDNSKLSSFNSNGFTVGSDQLVNQNNEDFTSWNFKKQKGFFTMVEYTGNGADDRAISHDLGCIPGMIIVAPLNDAGTRTVYHRGSGATKYLALNDSQAESTDEFWADTTPTASNFYVQGSKTNANNTTFIAYLFAGGTSGATAAKSVSFDGSNDYLSIPDSNDWTLGDTFTIEAWIWPDSQAMANGYYGMIASQRDTANQGQWYMTIRGDNPDGMQFYGGTGGNAVAINSDHNVIPDTQWTHVAFVANSGSGQWYINGEASGAAQSIDVDTNLTTDLEIGRYNSGSYFKGKISNLRIVKGTAVYTGAFIPSTEPLGNITNTKLLCCQSSTVTTATVSPGTITNNGATASSDSPFDDPAGYIFGEGGDQNVITCGYHEHYGTPSADPVFINTGWEPQFVMAKNVSQSSNWGVIDNCRGMFNGEDVGNDSPSLAWDSNAAENGVLGANKFIYPRGNGFEMRYGSTFLNPSNGNKVVYMAIRAPDGLVSEPVTTGTDVFAMDVGNGSSNGPCFDSAFLVNMAMRKNPTSNEDSWWVVNRITGKMYLKTDTNDDEVNHNDNDVDYSDGWADGSIGSAMQSWMWRRHAGHETVAYKGSGVARTIRHNLGVAPEIMFVKRRNTDRYWGVYHTGLGDNRFLLKLNEAEDYTNDTAAWNNTAPNAYGFSVGTSTTTNADGDDYIAMLFASVDKVSKCGSYTGNGSTSGPQIDVGFDVRYLWIKRKDGDGWLVFDTLRQFTTSASKYLAFNNDNSQETVSPHLAVAISNGFAITSSGTSINYDGKTFVYYAHA